MLFLDKYRQLQKKQVKSCVYDEISTILVTDIFNESVAFLASLDREELISKVSGKEYFAYRSGNKTSRAINKALYCDRSERWEMLKGCMFENDLSQMSIADLEIALYSLSMSFCAAVDIVKEKDQQTPGTYFNYLVAYFISWRLGVVPNTSITIMSMEGEPEVKLQTDLLYDLGYNKPKFHVPVKTSSRERAIMLWAHQRLLDGAYGIERYMGTPVLMAETKTDKKKGEVVEICLPDQWKVYQLYIARLKRIYYLVLPAPYLRLQQEFPPIMVKSFADFFSEWKELMPA